jgi:hypothetical protein
MLRQCRTTTKTIEPFDRLRESERAPAKSGAFFLAYFSLLKNNSELAGSPKIKMGEAIGFLLFVVPARSDAYSSFYGVSCLFLGPRIVQGSCKLSRCPGLRNFWQLVLEVI